MKPKNKERPQNRDGESINLVYLGCLLAGVPSGEECSKWKECLHRGLSEGIKEDMKDHAHTGPPSLPTLRSEGGLPLSRKSCLL